MTSTLDDLVDNGTAEEVAASPPEKLTLDTIAGLQITRPAAEGYINMLLYGEPGVGKTRLAGSASLVADMSPVLLIDFEGGTLSLGRDYPNVDVVRCMSWEKLASVYEQLYSKNPYRTIILDSLTETQKFSMQQLMKKVVADNPDRDPDVPSVREWGKSGEQIRRLVRALRDLPCNTIITALHHETYDEGTVIKIRPALPGQLKGEVAGYVDLVSYMYKKHSRRGGVDSSMTLMLSQGTEKVIAKDRSGMLPTVMEEPTMKKIHDAMNGKDSAET